MATFINGCHPASPLRAVGGNPKPALLQAALDHQESDAESNEQSAKRIGEELAKTSSDYTENQ